MENKTYPCVYKPLKQLVNSKNHLLAVESGANERHNQAAVQKSAQRTKNAVESPGQVLWSTLCQISCGSPAEYLTEQNYALQGLTKIFLKGHKVQCFLKRELKILHAHKTTALRVHFIQLDPFQQILGKTNSYYVQNWERNIMQKMRISSMPLP